MLIPIRPGDDAYVSHSGAVFHEQNEAGNGNVAYYEIQNTTDEIVFTLADNMNGISNPLLALYTQWGATDFALYDDINGGAIVDEQSGYDTDIWHVEVGDTSGKLRLTDFDTDDGVDGTQAAWLPFAGLSPL